jgi:hypothetical protein
MKSTTSEAFSNYKNYKCGCSHTLPARKKVLKEMDFHETYSVVTIMKGTRFNKVERGNHTY